MFAWTLRREQSSPEELANSLSSALGLVAIFAGIPFLLMSAAHRGIYSLIGCAVFAVSMIALYLASTIYHALPKGTLKKRARIFDHASIYLLIAGTYTPFALGALRGLWGWTLIAVVWPLAISGVVFKLFGGTEAKKLSVVLYILMGWIGIFAIYPFCLHVPPTGRLLVAAGGLAYTTGVIFYIARRLPFHHLVWHLFVTAGTVCHFLAVLWYAG